MKSSTGTLPPSDHLVFSAISPSPGCSWLVAAGGGEAAGSGSAATNIKRTLSRARFFQFAQFLHLLNHFPRQYLRAIFLVLKNIYKLTLIKEK